jgi:hypothetical protein
MRRAAVVAGAALVLLGPAAGTHPAAGAPAVPGGSWGTAREVPGIAPLQQSPANAQIGVVSCASAGNCSAGGYHVESSGFQAMVVSEVHGTWGRPRLVPGIAALDPGGFAYVNSMSCASAGNCSAGGSYEFATQLFVVTQVHGTWGKAIEIPGLAALNRGGSAQMGALSCGSAGNCSAGGYYLRSSSGFEQAFLVSQVRGTWGKARQVPGLAALEHGGIAETDSVSCASAGNCSAGGWYQNGTGPSRIETAFVVSEVHGTWGIARQVPGLAALNKGGVAEIFSVSCASAGNCSAGGPYEDGSPRAQAFVVSQVHGTWGKAIEVPGTAALNKGNSTGTEHVSCASAGNCSAGGDYLESSSGPTQMFVVSEVNGRWGKAIEVPGTAALNRGGNADISSVSCASAGNCTAGGAYADRSGNFQAFVVSEVNGRWGKAIEVPGTAALNRGADAGVFSVSCASAGNCTAGGAYADSSGKQEGFVVSEVHGTWGKAREVPAPPP